MNRLYSDGVQVSAARGSQTNEETNEGRFPGVLSLPDLSGLKINGGGDGGLWEQVSKLQDVTSDLVRNANRLKQDVGLLRGKEGYMGASVDEIDDRLWWL
ncbi:MAG: hypothetical protein LBP35_01505 [Candidatus Ancillula trichonymphae]|nr:hypothetical protein [Candidatus Ancillula trichonymphae]